MKFNPKFRENGRVDSTIKEISNPFPDFRRLFHWNLLIIHPQQRPSGESPWSKDDQRKPINPWNNVDMRSQSDDIRAQRCGMGASSIDNMRMNDNIIRSQRSEMSASRGPSIGVRINDDIFSSQRSEIRGPSGDDMRGDRLSGDGGWNSEFNSRQRSPMWINEGIRLTANNGNNMWNKYIDNMNPRDYPMEDY